MKNGPTQALQDGNSPGWLGCGLSVAVGAGGEVPACVSGEFGASAEMGVSGEIAPMGTSASAKWCWRGCEEVLEGLSRMRPVRRSALMSVRDDLSAPRTGLSERELEIIGLVATGLTNQEIGEQLMISKRTVDNHVSNIFTKTGAKNRVALLNWAMDNGKICRDGFNCCNLPAPSPGL